MKQRVIAAIDRRIANKQKLIRDTMSTVTNSRYLDQIRTLQSLRTEVLTFEDADEDDEDDVVVIIGKCTCDRYSDGKLKSGADTSQCPLLDHRRLSLSAK